MEVLEDSSLLLLRTYKKGKWSDVTITNGDKEYRVHKHILSTAIPYFDKMFSSGLSESTSEVIKLDHPPHVFDLIIEWAYCSKIKITKENAVDLFHLADYMNIPKLTTVCLNFLWNNFSDSPFIDVGYWINQISTEQVNNIIDQYIRSNFLDIVHTNSFLDYDFDTVAYMISLDNLDIDNEMQVFDAIMRWIQKSVERRSHLSKLLRKVHWVDINGFHFMKRLDILSWILKCDQARHELMAAVELCYFKSLKTIQVIDFNFGPRNKSESCCYSVYRNNGSSIDLHHFDRKHESINLSENLSLPAANFGDSNITEHIIESDVVIRIDWKNETYRLFKDSDRYSYCLLFGRLFRFDKNDRKVHFWKGERLIELSILSDGYTTYRSIFTLTKHKGGLWISIIDEEKGSYNQNFHQNHKAYEWKLKIFECTSSENRFAFVASHEIFTEEPIKKLKSTSFHDLLIIFIDCKSILSYDFEKHIFKEHENNLKGRSLCFLHHHHFGPRLLLFNNDGRQSRQYFHVVSGELSSLPDFDEPNAGIVSSQNLIGFISLKAKQLANMNDFQFE